MQHIQLNGLEGVYLQLKLRVKRRFILRREEYYFKTNPRLKKKNTNPKSLALLLAVASLERCIWSKVTMYLVQGHDINIT